MERGALSIGMLTLCRIMARIEEIAYNDMEMSLWMKNGQTLCYYIPPRYPNGFASGKPADYFTEAQAQEGLYAADRIIRFCEGHLPGSG